MAKQEMNSDFNSLDKLAEQLSEIRPAKPNAQLAHRLEMALHQADKEIAEPTNIVYHPFFQRALAMAALFVALVVAFQSTRFDPSSEMAGFAAGDSELVQLVDGELIPFDRGSLQEVSYSGLDVVNGQAVQRFRAGDTTVYRILEVNKNEKPNVEKEEDAK
ncbi:MAG: hypothetical protein AAF585_00085 [Verrucomicrobiota bacterium]